MKSSRLCIVAVVTVLCLFLWADARTACTSDSTTTCGSNGRCVDGFCECIRTCNNETGDCGTYADSINGACSFFILDTNVTQTNCSAVPQICGAHGNCVNGTCECFRNCDTPSTCGVWFSSANGLISVNDTGICDQFSQCQVGLVCAYCNSTIPIWRNTSQCDVCTTNDECSFYDQQNLISDLPTVGLNTTDQYLVNPWGMAALESGPWWITDAGTNKITVYRGNGTLVSLVIDVPPLNSGNSTNSNDTSSSNSTVVPTGPTGIVANNDNSTFILPESVSPVTNTSAKFIVATLDGTIQAWTSGNSTVMIANRTDSVYTGLAIARYTIISNSTNTNSTDNSGSTNTTTTNVSFLMASNFAQRKIDIWDSEFKFLGSFSDPALPANYSIFNVANINSTLFVTFAVRDNVTGEDVAGAGNGGVAVINFLTGSITHLLVGDEHLNSPYGVAWAPNDFGIYSGALLVANKGDGRINAFNATSGEYLGTLHNRKYHTILLDNGLSSIAFGNNGAAGQFNELFFVSGVRDEKHGLFGKLVPGGTCSSGQCSTDDNSSN